MIPLVVEAEMEMEEAVEAEVKEVTEIPASTDYEALKNQPKINGVTLVGDKTSEELMLLGEIFNEEILRIWNTVNKE